MCTCANRKNPENLAPRQRAFSRIQSSAFSGEKCIHFARKTSPRSWKTLFLRFRYSRKNDFQREESGFPAHGPSHPERSVLIHDYVIARPHQKSHLFIEKLTSRQTPTNTLFRTFLDEHFLPSFQFRSREKKLVWLMSGFSLAREVWR